jgi:hypothetical protein
MKSKRHLARVNNQENTYNFSCQVCRKTYTTRSGLWRHSQKCSASSHIAEPTTVDISTTNMMTIIMEKLEKVEESNGKLLETIENMRTKMTPSNITNNTTNNTNNYITIQELKVYLNTECKDAKTIFDFIENMNMTVAEKCELELSNYNNVVMNIWKRNYMTLSKNERPLYCVPTAESELTIFTKGDEDWREQPEAEFMTKLDIIPKYMHETMYATTAVNETCYKICEMYEDKMDNDEEIIKKLTPKSRGPDIGEWKQRKVHIWNEVCKFDAELRENTNPSLQES